METVDLVHYMPISKWQPMIGDFVIQHGWLTHWYGVVSGVNTKDYTVSVIKAGLPFLLFSMTPSKMEKSKIIVDIGDVTSSRGGKFAVQQQNGTTTIWFI